MHRLAVIAVLVAALGAPVLSEAQARSMGARVAPPPRSAPPRAMAPPARTRVMPVAVRPMRRPGSAFVAGSVQRRHHGHHVIFNTPCFAPNWVNPLCQPFFGFAGYPYFGYGYSYAYQPMFMDYSYAIQPAQQAQPQPQPAYIEDNSALRDEVSRLADQVQRLRDEQARQRTPAPREAPAPTALIYKDGRRVEVQNYAVVGQTLWMFNETRARKVPLSDLNLPATRAANEERGVEVSF